VIIAGTPSSRTLCPGCPSTEAIVKACQWFDIPSDADGYVFHPCVIDSVWIRGIGDPVYPFRRG
jgi:hypothetical protein